MILIVRCSYGGLALYGLVVLATRWRAYKVMTQDRRWLFLALAMEQSTVVLSAVLKSCAGAPADVSIFPTLLTQAAFACYLHYSVPRSFRRWPPRKGRT